MFLCSLAKWRRAHTHTHTTKLYNNFLTDVYTKDVTLVSHFFQFQQTQNKRKGLVHLYNICTHFLLKFCSYSLLKNNTKGCTSFTEQMWQESTFQYNHIVYRLINRENHNMVTIQIVFCTYLTIQTLCFCDLLRISLLLFHGDWTAYKNMVFTKECSIQMTTWSSSLMQSEMILASTQYKQHIMYMILLAVPSAG